MEVAGSNPAVPTRDLIGLVFQRISRPTHRAASICFSQRAIVTKFRGSWYLMARLCEQRRQQLTEAHVRTYCIRIDYNQHEHQHDEPGRDLADRCAL